MVRCIETTFGSLGTSAARGCPLCSLFEQSVSLHLSEKKIQLDPSITCRVAEYYTGDVALSIYWGTRQAEDPQIIIQLYRQPGTRSTGPSDVFPTRNHIIQDPGSNEAMALIRTWLDKCSTEHGHSPEPQTPTELPTRVIDVGLLDGSQQPKLVETDGQTGTYIALSHCWGKTQIITTKRSTIRDLKDGIEWSSLPKTFQDAITVTRKLQVAYIWIDSLCIVQDDPEDWEVEAAKMGSIYENAHLTIAATASSSGDQGLFKQRVPPRPLNFRDPSESSQDHVRIFAQAQPSHDGFSRRNHPDPHENPLLSRAWVYQERILSTRILHFGSKELVWECKWCYECECGGIGRCMRPWSQPTSVKQIYADALEGKTAPASIWDLIIREYTACALTFDRDRLPALGATARRLRDGLGSYYAGMWSSMLPDSLFWRGNVYAFENPGGAMVDANEHWMPATRSTAESRPPSWSWTSLEHAVIDICYAFTETWVRVLDACVTPALRDPFGAISKAHLKLSGPLLALDCSVVVGRYKHYRLGKGDAMTECFPDVPIEEDDPASSTTEIYGLIGGLDKYKSGTVHVLILKRKNSESCVFERVGIVPFAPLIWHEWAKETTIVLV